MNDIIPFTPGFFPSSLTWGTRNELLFLESLWRGKLDYPIGGTPIDQMSALRGYAEGFFRRRHWHGIDSSVIQRWLVGHSLLR